MPKALYDEFDVEFSLQQVC